MEVDSSFVPKEMVLSINQIPEQSPEIEGRIQAMQKRYEFL